jgi:hypothetical protein
MSHPIQIWTSAAFHPGFRCGGWASVRVVGAAVTGAAGGERDTTAGRMALAGLAAGLRDLPSGAGAAGVASIGIRTTNPDLARLADTLGSLGPAALPEENRDLWSQILTASAGRRLILTLEPLKPGAPTAFTTAWAELARDKAKAGGPFSAGIPKSNLAKVAGLA